MVMDSSATVNQVEYPIGNVIIMLKNIEYAEQIKLIQLDSVSFKIYIYTT